MTINENNLQKQNNTFTLATSQKYASENIVINTQVKKAVLTSDSSSNNFSIEYPISINDTDTITFTTNNNATTAVNGNGNTIDLTGGSGSSPVAGNSIAQYNDVIFIDYDGTIRYSYSATQFASLTELPPNPSHSGLTAQGWNWTLTDAKTIVATYGYLTIGQNYTTSDTKTHIFINLNGERRSPKLGICIDGTVDIDWGDNSTHETITGSSTSTLVYSTAHEYAVNGNYEIILTITGSAGLCGVRNSNGGTALLRHADSNDGRNNYYANCIKKVQIGANIINIQTSAFYNCYNMQSITIPTTCTAKVLGMYAFYQCHSLTGIVLPSHIIQINERAFMHCYQLRYIALNSISTINQYTFHSCYNLQQIYIKSSIKTIPIYFLYLAYSMTKLIFPSSLTTIKGYICNNCYSLTKIIIPSNVTSIDAGAFSQCVSLKEIHFLPTSPPTAASSATFSGFPSDCIIYVPTDSLSAYTSEANYPSSSSYTYVEE